MLIRVQELMRKSYLDFTIRFRIEGMQGAVQAAWKSTPRRNFLVQLTLKTRQGIKRAMCLRSMDRTDKHFYLGELLRSHSQTYKPFSNSSNTTDLKVCFLEKKKKKLLVLL